MTDGVEVTEVDDGVGVRKVEDVSGVGDIEYGSLEGRCWSKICLDEVVVGEVEDGVLE